MVNDEYHEPLTMESGKGEFPSVIDLASSPACRQQSNALDHSPFTIHYSLFLKEF